MRGILDEERCQLGFTDAVIEHIEPILEKFGFERVEASCRFVVYQSSDVSLDIVHDLLSNEIGIELQRLHPPLERCTFGAVLLSAGESYSFQASTLKRVDAVVGRIAGLLQEYGRKVLIGDVETYQRLSNELKERSKQYTKKFVLGPIRDAAKAAWKKQDFVAVIELYESIEKELTALERRRLIYARSNTHEN